MRGGQYTLLRPELLLLGAPVRKYGPYARVSPLLGPIPARTPIHTHIYARTTQAFTQIYQAWVCAWVCVCGCDLGRGEGIGGRLGSLMRYPTSLPPVPNLLISTVGAWGRAGVSISRFPALPPYPFPRIYQSFLRTV